MVPVAADKERDCRIAKSLLVGRGHFLCYSIERIVKFAAVFAYDGIFEEFIYRYFQLLTQLTGGLAHGFARLVIHRFIAGHLLDANRI